VAVFGLDPKAGSDPFRSRCVPAYQHDRVAAPTFDPRADAVGPKAGPVRSVPISLDDPAEAPRRDRRADPVTDLAAGPKLDLTVGLDLAARADRKRDRNSGAAIEIGTVG